MSLEPRRLAPDAAAALESVAAAPWSDEAYLAGSAALALRLGHRRARDLDLMSASNRLRPADRRELLRELLAVDSAARIETARDGFLYARLASGVAVRVYYYPYPLVEPVDEVAGVAVASLIDLGLMKLAAVISRGARRDFVDLYFLSRRLPLDDLLARAGDKFGHVRDFPLQALKGLADLSQIAAEPMPSLRRELEWAVVEKWVDGEVRRLGRESVGLPRHDARRGGTGATEGR